jgi:hypothetical protein
MKAERSVLVRDLHRPVHVRFHQQVARPESAISPCNRQSVCTRAEAEPVN